jgi:hypothetical protein
LRYRLWTTLFSLALVACATPAGAAQNQGASVTLTWSAPGDDSLSGLAWRYDLRYDLTPITPQSFVIAIPVEGLPWPVTPGHRQTFTVTGLAPGARYYFAIRTADERGNWSRISNVVQRVAGNAAVSAEIPPLALGLSSPWPNPAHRETRVSMTLPQSADVSVQAFDLSGRLVRTIATGPREAGRTELIWNLQDGSGRRVPAGVYLLLARLGDRTFTRRVTVVP